MATQRTQIRGDRRIVNAAWKWVKRQTAKWRRRQEKRDPEDAPKRGTSGWTA